MRILLAAVLSAAFLTGCSADNTPQESEPVATQDVELTAEPTYLDHVSDIQCLEPAAGTYDDQTILIKFTVTNKGTEAAKYTPTFGVYDSTGVQVGGFGTDVAGTMGPTPAGGIVKYSAHHGLASGTVPHPFTCKLASVDRQPA